MHFGDAVAAMVIVATPGQRHEATQLARLTLARRAHRRVGRAAAGEPGLAAYSGALGMSTQRIR